MTGRKTSGKLADQTLLMATLKKRIFNILEVSERPGDLSWKVDVFIITLIILNVAAIVIESIQPVYQQFPAFFFWFEAISVFIFSVEYVLRIWSANEHPDFRTPVTGNIRYAFTPLLIIDFLAILPFFLPLLGIDLRLLRILRVFRVFRIFKVARYVKALTLINDVVKEKREELIIAIFFTLFMLLITSTIMYYVENAAQPENFSSIPETMWWGIATLTTVGYGDIYPITGFGKFLGGIIAIIGVGLFALPAGILASGFGDQLAKARDEQKNDCPHCGKKHDQE